MRKECKYKSSTMKFGAVAILACLFFINSEYRAISQTIIEIGDSEVVLQSPFCFKKHKDLSKNVQQISKRRYFNEFFLGLGFAAPFDRSSVMTVQYGNSYNFDIGFRYFFKTSKHYAIGTMVQYSYYAYKLKDAAINDLFYTDMPKDVVNEYYRTNNIGTGIINRFYLYPFDIRRPLKFDIGLFADFSFSKSYTVKYALNGHEHKYRYSDGSKFNPFQLGVHGAISLKGWSIYGRYRISNLFDHNQIKSELPRFSIGLQIVL